MKTNDFDSELQDPVWALLGRARRICVSPFFARNVLRELREGRSTWSLFQAFFQQSGRFACAGAAVLVVILGLSSALLQTREGAGNTLAVLVQRPVDMEIVTRLDELLISDDDTKVWLDSEPSVYY